MLKIRTNKVAWASGRDCLALAAFGPQGVNRGHDGNTYPIIR